MDDFRPTRDCYECQSCGSELTRENILLICDCGKEYCQKCSRICVKCGYVGCRDCVKDNEDNRSLCHMCKMYSEEPVQEQKGETTS